MNRIDQLGVIRNAISGAHHPRWEYVILQINLINRLCEIEETKGLGLSSNVTEFLGRNPSGAEILQMWALLFNSGHLPGTFATERAFLNYCKNQRILKNTIKNGLPTTQKEYLEQILDKEEIYSFHKILISFHLQRYKTFREFDTEDSSFVDFLQEILNLYIFEQENKDLEEKRNKLKYIFFRVRQMSYLFLDTQYFPFPINFDLSKIFLNLDEYIDVLFKEPQSQMIKSMDSFDDLLSINMYHSMESISELGHHSKEVEKILKEDQETHELNKIRELQKYLMKQYKKFQPFQITDIIDGTCFHLLFDLQSDLSLKDSFKKNLSFEFEEKLNKRFGYNKCNLTFQSSPTLKHSAITLLLFEDYSKRNIEIMAKFLKEIVSLNYKIKYDNPKRSNNIDKIFQMPCKELITDILKYITSENLYFEFKEMNNDIFILPVRGSKTAVTKITSINKNLSVSKSREYEIKALKEALNEIDNRNEFLISLSQILVYDADREEITDLDGFGIGYKEGKIIILLVEAKNLRSGAIGESRKQLTTTLSRIKLKTSKEPIIKNLPTIKGVYTYITIDV